MEYNLIQSRIIDYNASNHKDSIFTIEKYFNGQYLNYSRNEKVKLYPEYLLPDSNTYFTYSRFADSLNFKNYTSCKEKHCAKYQLVNCICYENITSKTDSLPYGYDPTSETNCSFCKKALVTHLKGNVREMTNIEGVFYGLSFIDSCGLDFNKCRIDNNLVNSYTGFRNVCRYKEWGK